MCALREHEIKACGASGDMSSGHVKAKEETKQKTTTKPTKIMVEGNGYGSINLNNKNGKVYLITPLYDDGLHIQSNITTKSYFTCEHSEPT